ncbi:MAG: hypothetical protein U9N59_15450 [Campylobacterota bacterium]|nr:hypothetical protein [Campylobacterota bacterium]
MKTPTQEDWDNKFEEDSKKSTIAHKKKQRIKHQEVEERKKSLIYQNAIAKEYFATNDTIIVTVGTLLFLLILPLYNYKIYWLFFFPMLVIGTSVYYTYRKNKIKNYYNTLSETTIESIIEKEKEKEHKSYKRFQKFYKVLLFFIILILIYAIIKNNLEVLSYFNIIDYVFLSITCLSLSLLLYQILFDDIELYGELFLALIVLLPMLYLNYIPNGEYKAIFTNINNKVIGEGTKKREPFNIDIGSNYIQFDNKHKINIDNNRSNLYVDIYGKKDFSLLVTKMGTVKIISDAVTANIEVKY